MNCDPTPGALECLTDRTVDISALPARVRQSRRRLERERVVVIAISGLHGAGKTTVARALAKKFGLRYVCAGTIFRQLAKENGMTLEEFSRYAERNPAIDRLIDERTVAAAEEGDVLIDARLAGWMAKQADLKILLTAPLEVRVRRIARRERRSYREVLKETVRREESEARRFRRLYRINVNDLSPFDLIVNNKNLAAEETTRLLELAVELIAKGRFRRGS